MDPDQRENYLDGCQVTVEAARRAPGCLDFALTADLIEPDRINVYERWESDEQLMRFRNSDPDSAQQTTLREAQVAKFEVADVLAV